MSHKGSHNKTFPVRFYVFAFEIIMRRIGTQCEILMTFLIFPLILIDMSVSVSQTGFDFTELGKYLQLSLIISNHGLTKRRPIQTIYLIILDVTLANDP